MHKLTSHFLILVFILFVGGAYGQEFDSDGAEIRAQVEGWLAAWNRQDTDAVASYYDDDADWTHAYGAVRRGKPEIQKRYAEVFSAVLPEGVARKLTMEIHSVRFITSDVAVVDGEYEYSGLLAAPNLKGQGRQTIVMVKRDGRWLRAAQRNWIPMTSECLELAAGK